MLRTSSEIAREIDVDAIIASQSFKKARHLFHEGRKNGQFKNLPCPFCRKRQDLIPISTVSIVLCWDCYRNHTIAVQIKDLIDRARKAYLEHVEYGIPLTGRSNCPACGSILPEGAHLVVEEDKEIVVCDFCAAIFR